MAPLAFLAQGLAEDLVATVEPAVGVPADVCAALNWTFHFSECPYGWAGPGDVTWPDYAKAKRLNAPVQEEFDAPPPFLYLCVVWSYVPFAVCFLAVLKVLMWRSLWPLPSVCARLSGRDDAEQQEERPYAYLRLRRHGTKEIAYALLLLLIAGCNEFIIKKLVAMPRPEMSCSTTCGMPSSHAAVATGTMTLGLLDFAHRCFPRKAISTLSVFEARSLPTEPGLPLRRRFWPFVKQCLYDSLGSLQLAPFDEPSALALVGYATVWCLVMLPVPLSRIQLSDHTPMQVLAGAALGLVIATLWFYFLQSQLSRYNHLLGKRWPGNASWGFEHNLGLSCCSALMRCNPHSASPKEGFEMRLQRQGPDETAGDPPFRWLLESIDELRWYREQTTQRKVEMQYMGTLTQVEDLYLTTRYCRIDELIELLSLELWLAEEILSPDCEAAVLRRFLGHLTAPDPEGLGIQTRGCLQRLRPQELRDSWQPAWEDDRSLLERLCGWCEAPAAGADAIATSAISVSTRSDRQSSCSLLGLPCSCREQPE